MTQQTSHASTFSPVRIAIALAIAGGIYGASLGVGALLYGTGVIATGATHAECSEYRQQIAEERGIDEEDVEQSEIKAATIACLAKKEYVHSEREAFREEYLFAAIWPAVICAVIFLLWPAWTRILLRQEDAETAEDAPRMEPGT